MIGFVEVYPTSLGFRILGSLEVEADGRQLTIGSPRQRIVLAMLLLSSDCVISVDSLVEAVWDGFPPATGRTQIAICINGLRKLFAAAGYDDVIVTASPGYKLVAARCRIDAQEFSRLVDQGHAALGAGRTAEAAARLDEALKLWRGEVLSGVPSAIVAAKALHLEDKRLAVHEECLALKVELGQHADLVPELTALVREHPLREDARASLMLAQYRAGRRSEALEIFNEGRRHLVDELGLEPGPRLRAMQTAILRDDPELQRETTAAAPVAWASVVPAQLQPMAPGFTGRRAELDALDDLLRRRSHGGPLPVGVLTGQIGVGKTALALHWAHRSVSSFPDGQLFADLRGWDADYPVAEATAVLSGFLRALGMPLSEIPARLEEQSSLYNSLLDGRQVLVVLDNVRSYAQARPLMPGSGTCCVLLTGRSLSDAHGIVRLHVPPLPVAESAALVRALVGEERARDEQAALLRLGELCDGLPLALWSAAVRLADRSHWTVGDLVSRLEDPGRRLDEIGRGMWDIRARIAPSYQALGPQPARTLRGLGRLGLPEVTAPLAATILGCPMIEAEEVLEELRAAGFLQPPRRDGEGGLRYRLPGLFARYAVEQLEEPVLQDQWGHERRAALHR